MNIYTVTTNYRYYGYGKHAFSYIYYSRPVSYLAQREERGVVLPEEWAHGQ